MKILDVDALLQARIMLLDLIPMKGIGGKIVKQKESEIGVQGKQRACEETIKLQDVPVCEIPFVIRSEGAKTGPSAIERVDETEAVDLTAGHEIERNLPGGIEIVGAEVELKSQ